VCRSPSEYFVGADARRIEFRQAAGGEIRGGALCVGDECGDFLRFGEGLVAVSEFVLTGFLARVIKLTGVYPEIFGRWEIVHRGKVGPNAAWSEFVWHPHLSHWICLSAGCFATFSPHHSAGVPLC